MTKSEFISKISEILGSAYTTNPKTLESTKLVDISQPQIEAVLTAVGKVVSDELAATGSSSVPGIVELQAVKVPARDYRDPMNGGIVSKPACQRLRAAPTHSLRRVAAAASIAEKAKAPLSEAQQRNAERLRKLREQRQAA